MMFNIHKLPVVLVAITLGLGICMPAAQAIILGGEDWNELIEAAPGFTFAEGNTGGLVYTDPLSGITINGESGAIPTIGQPGTAWGFMPGTTNPTLTPEPDSGSVFLRYLTKRKASFNVSTGLENNVRWGGLEFQAGGEDSEGLMHIGAVGLNKGFFGFQDRTVEPAGSQIPSTVPFDLDTVYFVVAEMDIDNELARLWINPDFGATAPTPDLEVFNVSIDPSPWAPSASGRIGSILLKAGTVADDFPTNDKYMTADEMVIGTTWGDVVPVPPAITGGSDSVTVPEPTTLLLCLVCLVVFTVQQTRLDKRSSASE
ncbi:MAG: hypothetical protein ABGX16_08835 [Pirellulales bacterium]